RDSAHDQGPRPASRAKSRLNGPVGLLHADLLLAMSSGDGRFTETIKSSKYPAATTKKSPVWGLFYRRLLRGGALRKRVPSGRACRTGPSGANHDQTKIANGAATMNMSTDFQPVADEATATRPAAANTSGQTRI